MKPFFFILFLILITACLHNKTAVVLLHHVPYYDSVFKAQPAFVSRGFDYPVGKPDAKGYYDAQPFGHNTHLGNDWNATTGGNSDLGDTVYSIGSGVVSCAENFGGGWGNVVRIVHCLDTARHVYIESLYAHLQQMMVSKGQMLECGTSVGSIGNCNGQYYAHLHFEIRRIPGMELGGGYASDTTGFLDPTAFIKSHRKK